MSQVSRKSHPHAPSVLALCKKFQPDYEKPAKLSHHAVGHVGHVSHAGECGSLECECRLLRAARAAPDRAVLC